MMLKVVIMVLVLCQLPRNNDCLLSTELVCLHVDHWPLVEGGVSHNDVDVTQIHKKQKA